MIPFTECCIAKFLWHGVHISCRDVLYLTCLLGGYNSLSYQALSKMKLEGHLGEVEALFRTALDKTSPQSVRIF